MLPGPPYAITSTATWSGEGSAAMYEIHDRPDSRYIGLGKHTVAEVEDVAGPAGGAFEDGRYLTVALGGRSEQRDRLEIPLNRAIPDPRPCRVERNAPVDADHVAARCRKILEKGGGARAEVDHWHV